jgi:predicted DNA-binding transcriptional regulator YafY
MPGRKKGNFTQAGRILKLVQLFQSSRYGFTMAELAEKHGVTDRQMRRDLELLDGAGYTIEQSVADDGKLRHRFGPTGRRAVMLTMRER